MINKKEEFFNQNGQALLVIMLVMVIAFTVGLSLVTSTIINLRNTSDQASSQKALSAAEAGAEQAIKQNAADPKTVSVSNSNFQTAGAVTSYNAQVTQEDTSSPFLLNGLNGAPVQQNDAIYVWVKPYSSDTATAFTQTWSGDFTVYWGDSNIDCNNAALEVAVIYGSKTNPLIKRYAFDQCGTRRSSGVNGNNFKAVSLTGGTVVGGKTLYLQDTESLSNVLLIRINPVYKDSVIGVYGTGVSGPLAAQGKTITSVGKSDNGTVRKISVFEGYPEVPAEFFPYILFNPK